MPSFVDQMRKLQAAQKDALYRDDLETTEEDDPNLDPKRRRELQLKRRRKNESEGVPQLPEGTV